MQALWIEKGRMELRDLPPPNPAPGEALIRVEMAGVCRTDLELMRGYMDFRGTPGHEFAGVVEKCADRPWTGKRVVGEINLPCGDCAFCRAGLPRHCPAREVLGIVGRPGAFAEFITLPFANLHEVPPGMSVETAVFTEPVAACFEVLGQVEVKGKRTAVLGDGKLGILMARVLAAQGARVTLAGRHRDKLELANQDAVETVMIEALLERTRDPGQKFELTVEAAGRAEGFAAALDVTRPRGVIVQKSTVAGAVPVDLARVAVDEITVIGSRCGPFAPALAALAKGEVEVRDLVDGIYPLSRAVEALAAAARPGALKILIAMPGGSAS